MPFGSFGYDSSMDLPAEAQIRWLLRRTAALLQLGAEPVRGLVLPTGDFFPDTFDGTPPSLAALMRRVQAHAGLADLAVELAVVSPEGEAQTVSCSSGACGGGGKFDVSLDRVRVTEDGGYQVTIAAGEVKNPTVLTTALVRAVAFMFLNEAGGYDELPPQDREPVTDLAAVLLGFGVLAANGSYIYMKGCGGVNVHSATRMPADEIGLALGLFCQLHGIPERVAAKHLELTPREHFEEGAVWSASNASTVKLLRSAPERIEKDLYTLSPARSWLARALGMGAKKKEQGPEDEMAAFERALVEKRGAAKKPVDPEKAKRLAELRALVDESLDGAAR